MIGTVQNHKAFRYVFSDAEQFFSIEFTNLNITKQKAHGGRHPH